MDIVPTLLATIQADFDEAIRKDSLLIRIQKKIDAGTATYQDANDFAVEAGQVLAKIYKKHLSSDVLPDGRMYYNIAERILYPTLKRNHELIAGTAADVQSTLNKAVNLGIKGIQSPVNQSRIDGFIERITSEAHFDDVAWILQEPVVVFSQSIIDEAIKINSEFHAKSGLSPKIVRKALGNCCDWCNSLKGIYSYPDVPQEVFQRHDYCRCTVDYHPGDGRSQNVHSKKWADPDESSKVQARKSIGESPRVLRKDAILTNRFMRGSGKNYPVRFVGADHVKFDAEMIDKVTVIAGKGVKAPIRESARLEGYYQQPKNRWEKLSGESYILVKGRRLKVEIHWYEANGNRYEIKVKRVIGNEG